MTEEIKTAEQITKDIVENKDQVIRIMIGVPILAWTHEFATSFLRFWTELMTYQHKGRNFQICYEFMYRRPVHLAEEDLAQKALDLGCTHLLLMDDDIYNPSVDYLLKLLDADKDVIGGVMYTSGFPYAMCAFRRFDPTKSVADQPRLEDSCRLYEVPADQRVGIQPIDLIPFGFTMIKTSVFKKLEKPWFRCDSMAPTDSWFADSILNANLEYFVHFDVWLNHRGVTKENRDHYMQIGFIDSQIQNKGRVVLLTPEEMARHEAMVRIRMQEAEDNFKKSERAKFKVFEKREDTPIAVPIGGENVGASAQQSKA